MSSSPPPPPEETAVGGRTPKVNMTPHLQKKKGTGSAAGILDVDMSLLCPSLTSVGSSAAATAGGAAAAAGTAASGTASSAATATTASTSASSAPSSPSSSTTAIFTKSFQTSTEVINRFSTLTFSSASFKVRNGSSTAGKTTTTTATTHVSNKRWNAFHTPELEQLVKSISSALTDTDATYGSSTATLCNHKIMDVTFEPRGCKWDAMVVPVPNDDSDYSRDATANEARKSGGGGGGGAAGRRKNSTGSSSSSIFRLPPPFHIQLVCSAVCEKNIGDGGGGDDDRGGGEMAKPSTKSTTAPGGGAAAAAIDEAKNEASPAVSSSRDSVDASAAASGSGAAIEEGKEGGGGGGEEEEDTHADDKNKEQAEQKHISSGVSNLHLNNNKSSTHQHHHHHHHRGPVQYVIDYKLLPDTTTNDDDDIDEAETDRHTVMKKIFDEIGFDIKKAVVRCEFPEFPEGCKGIVFRDVYQLNARLKSGSFATVCRGTHRETKKKVAIKCVLRKDLPPSDDAAIFDEVAILASLKHRYVVQLIDFFVEKECYFIVMELMAGGDLFDRIGKKKTYTERDARDLCRKMLEAMAYCHSKNIAHCDMKPKNLLLKSEEDDSFIKLADFGFAARVYSPKSLSKQCGTPFFVAPEILMRSPYDQASDMWSVGCIVYLLLCGNLPFMGRTQRELFRKIVVGKFEFPEEEWSHISDDAKDLVSRLLVTDPDKRMTAADALRSKWIRQNAMRLQRNSLLQTSQRLKTFNARMKLRSAMIAVDWVSTMSRSMSWTRSSKSLGREGSGNSTGFASILSQASNEDAANELPSPPGPQRQASIKEEEAAPPAKKGNLAALIRDAASNDEEGKSPRSAGPHRQVSIKEEKAAPSGKKGNLAAMIARGKDAAN